MEFAKQLKKLRTEKELSQEEIANAVHVTRQAVSRWEAGTSTPDLETAVQLAKFFNVSLDYLVLNDGPVDEVTNKQILDTISTLSKSDNNTFFDHLDDWIMMAAILVLTYMTYHFGIGKIF